MVLRRRNLINRLDVLRIVYTGDYALRLCMAITPFYMPWPPWVTQTQKGLCLVTQGGQGKYNTLHIVPLLPGFWLLLTLANIFV